jgi:hypothetical protein
MSLSLYHIRERCQILSGYQRLVRDKYVRTYLGMQTYHVHDRQFWLIGELWEDYGAQNLDIS